jgi:hypothetical protein
VRWPVLYDQKFVVTHERVAGMLKDSAYGLRLMRRVDVAVTRRVRKAIFRHGLWCPRRIREQRSDLIIAGRTTSFQCRQSQQCFWSPSVALVRASATSPFRSSSPTLPQHPMTSFPLDLSRQCIWSPSIAVEPTSLSSSCSSSPSLSQPHYPMTSFQSRVTRQCGWFPSIGLDFSSASDNELSNAFQKQGLQSPSIGLDCSLTLSPSRDTLSAILTIIGNRPTPVVSRDAHRDSVLRPIRRAVLPKRSVVSLFSVPSLFVLDAAASSKPQAVEHLAVDLQSYNTDVSVMSESHFKAKHSDSVI